MRKLTLSEIETLRLQQCRAEDWEKIEVDDGFSAEFVQNVQFYGHNRLGKFTKIFKLENGVKRHSGIYSSTLHNCIVEDDSYIAAVNVIANYKIGKECFLTNTGTLSKNAGAAFGNGVFVAAVNENGGRKIPIFEKLSAQIAHILVFHRQYDEVCGNILKMIANYTGKQKKTVHGVIGEQAKIMNCKAVLDVKIGAGAVISGAELLQNGTVSSDLNAQTFVGAGVIAKDFIFGKSSKITDGAVIERCFAGEGSVVSKHFSATDCLFFANCEMLNGEAVSVFAAPYTVSHHRSNLLIASALSFANVGSGTNMSNHAYKLGAVHQGVMERGCKFASNSYLLFPAHIGAYSVIFGSHKNHPNVADLPFSYIMEENGQSVLIPAVNIFRIGTLRDVEKWQKRDRRQGKKHLDSITFDFLNPLIINKIVKGIDILQNLKNEKDDVEFYGYGNCKIHRHSLKKGIEYYQDALTVFMGEYLLNNQIDSKLKENILKFDEWTDLAGLILPKNVMFDVWHYISVDKITDFQRIDEEFSKIEKMYREFADCFTENFIGKQNISQKEILEKYVSVIEKIKRRLEKEAATEFFGNSKISYGIDFENQKDADFEQVKGNIEDNIFLKNLSENFENKIKQAKKNDYPQIGLPSD